MVSELLLRDSTDPFAIPLQGLAAVAGYGDGAWTWSSAGWARFPPPVVSLSIVVSAADVGDILDVEQGDAAPGDCPGWADRFRRPGRRRPTIYCNRGTIAAVRQAMGSRPFDWWAATLDGTVDVAGAVAVQARGADLTGGAYDESVILDPSWVGLEDDMTPDQSAKLDRIYTAVVSGVEDPANKTQFQKVVEAFLEPLAAQTPAAIAQAVVAALPPGAAGGLTQDQLQAAAAAAVAPVVEQLTRIEHALQGA